MQAVETRTAVQPEPPTVEPPAVPAAEQAPPASEVPAPCCAMQSKGSYRRWLIGAAVIGIPLALWSGWDWLAATGLATILIGVAPCLAMCALGLCMGRGKKVGPSLTDIRKTYETQSGEPPSRG